MSRARREEQTKLNAMLESACKVKIKEEKRLGKRVDLVNLELKDLLKKKKSVEDALSASKNELDEVNSQIKQKTEELIKVYDRIKLEKEGIERDKINRDIREKELKSKVAEHSEKVKNDEEKTCKDFTEFNELVKSKETLLEKIKINQNILEGAKEKLKQDRLDFAEMQFKRQEEVRKGKEEVAKDKAKITKIDKEKKQIDNRARQQIEKEKILGKKSEEQTKKDQDQNDRDIEQNATQARLDKQERRINNLIEANE